MASACQSPHYHRDTTIPPRELTEQSLRGTLDGMKLLDQDETAGHDSASARTSEREPVSSLGHDRCESTRMRVIEGLTPPARPL